jgi:hypothetical protein
VLQPAPFAAIGEEVVADLRLDSELGVCSDDVAEKGVREVGS